MQISEYRVGLVIGQAGLNAAQVRDIKDRLKFLAKLGAGDPGAIKVTVPVTRHAGPASAADMEALVAPLSEISYIAITIVENVWRAEAMFQLFHDHDEVWCCPSNRQTLSTHARAFTLYKMGAESTDRETVHKYKLIPPWVEPPVASARAVLKTRST